MLLDIIFRELDRIFGSPEDPTVPDDKVLFHGNNPQIIHPLAFAYETEAPGNRFFKHPVLLKAVRRIAEQLFSLDEVPRRIPATLFKASCLVRGDLGGEEGRWKGELQKVARMSVLPRLRDRDLLTRLTSANVGYGTNHLAMELADLTAYVSSFRSDDDFGRMDPGDPEVVEFSSDLLRRFFDYMHPDGYWAESDGPATSYNFLTSHALFLAASDLGQLETYRPQLSRAARFHCNTTLPNLNIIGVTNGRTQFAKGPSRLSFLGLCPEAATLARVLTEYHEANQVERAVRYPSESLNFFLTSHLALSDTSAEPAPFTWAGGDRTELLSDDFAIARRKGWIAAVSNLAFRPRPEGHWNLDYTALISLYHDSHGSVLCGANSKDDPLASTFHKRFTSFDSIPLPDDSPMWKYVPGKGKFEITSDGVELVRYYRGFEGILKFQALDGSRAVLDLRANARRSEYPIEATLMPPVRLGTTFTDGNGVERTVTGEPLRMSGKDLGASIRLGPEDVPNYFRDVERKPLTIRLPDDAVLLWPHALWNPYDLVNHRYQRVKDASALLLIPVGPEGARVEFRIG